MSSQVDEYQAAFNSPVAETVDEKRYTISQLKMRHIGSLNDAIARLARNPEQQFLDGLAIERFDELEDDEQAAMETAWNLARRMKRRWQVPTAMSQEGANLLLQTEEGQREFVRILFSTESPLAEGEEEQIRLGLRPKELLSLYEYAMGLDDSDPKARREVAVARSPN
jgi:hypothetical protein